MAETLTLARPYARAAFELAQAKGMLNAWADTLAFAAVVAADPRVATARTDPRADTAQLVKLHLPQDVATDTPFAHFLDELAGHGRLGLLPDIHLLFDGFKRESESVLKVKVTSAVELDAAQAETLKASLKRRFSRSIEMETAVDAELLAGVVIDTGSEVIDGSARARLKQLAGALT